MKRKVKATKAAKPDTLCPIARAEDVVGDRWTVLVLRELSVGNRRFEESRRRPERRRRWWPTG